MFANPFTTLLFATWSDEQPLLLNPQRLVLVTPTPTTTEPCAAQPFIRFDPHLSRPIELFQ